MFLFLSTYIYLFSLEPPVKVVKMHPPAPSAPVCVDPTSFTKPSSSGIPSNLKELTNSEIASLVLQDKVKDHQLEKLLDPHRAVEVRRLKVDVQLDSLGRGGAVLHSSEGEPAGSRPRGRGHPLLRWGES